MSDIVELEKQLNDFSLDARMDALAQLVGLAREGAITLAPEANAVNLHCHTFFSYNAYGYSPAGLAWLAKKSGFQAIGTVDFDVLDAVDEFMAACELAGVRGSCGLETRTYVPEFAAREINSPGEPGIYYHMGIGFTTGRIPATGQAVAASLRERAAQRNREMVKRVNAYLDPVTIDYERDVLPLTPACNPTERHMLIAYVRAADERAPHPAAFWASKLGMPVEQVEQLMGDAPKFQNTLRLKLMKRGGVGYVQPGPESFPSVDEVNRFIVACEALPCATWLDGLSEGEQSYEELLDLLVAKGAVALNIVPDRNWNVADPELRRVKVRKLYEVVELAARMDLPLNVGTEMNTYGQRLIDDFDAPELAPVRQAFLDGARFIYGHTVMQRALGLGYQSAWARTQLPSRRERNAFYMRAGYAIPPGRAGRERLGRLGGQPSPEEVLKAFRQAA